MPNEIFTDAWAAAWGAELDRSDAYRAAAVDWSDPMVFVQRGDPGAGREERAVLLDLDAGRCRGGRAASAGDRATAAFVLVASAADWRAILAGRLEPIAALMLGRLTLERGALAALVARTAAAREMVAAAARADGGAPEARE